MNTPASQIDTLNRRIVLARRPRGLPQLEDFRLERVAAPQPGQGQVLLRSLFLSLDPYMRNLMEATDPFYARSVQLGEPMVGGAVARVVTSRHPDFRPGDLALGAVGWQDYAALDGKDLTPLPQLDRPSLALGGHGMPGFTAYVGLLDIGRPQLGETVVVAAATGAVGSVVGQIAKLKGARVVGLASGPDKCRHAVEDLGFDACLDRKAPQLAERLAAACPNGIDVYFESVGGAVLDAAIPLLNVGARVPVCGLISHYNDSAPPPGPDRLPSLLTTLLQKRVRMEGFVILDHYADRFDAFQHDMKGWLADGHVKLREDLVKGLEAAPAAFIGLLEGRNFGKLVIQVAEA